MRQTRISTEEGHPVLHAAGGTLVPGAVRDRTSGSPSRRGRANVSRATTTDRDVPRYAVSIVKPVITQAEVPLSGELKIAKGTILTPSARDLAKDRGVKLVEVPAAEIDTTIPPEKTIALGSDHGGFATQGRPQAHLRASMDSSCGTSACTMRSRRTTPTSRVRWRRLSREEKAPRGVIIDGAGIGSSIVANKFPGIRAALCYDKASARISREHNDSNILTLGGRLADGEPRRKRSCGFG